MLPTIYDTNGDERSWDWMVDKYWPIAIREAVKSEPGFELVALFETADTVSEKQDSEPGAPAYILKAQKAMREKAKADPDATSALIAVMLNEDGEPMDGVQVAFYWPDADLDPNTGPKYGIIPEYMVPHRCVHGGTGGTGDVGFGMGSGAWVWPEDDMGPHGLHAYGIEVNSAVGFGFGMKALTNHDHMNAVFQLRPAEEPEPPECPREELLEQLDGLEKDLKQAKWRANKGLEKVAAMRALLEE